MEKEPLVPVFCGNCADSGAVVGLTVAARETYFPKLDIIADLYICPVCGNRVGINGRKSRGEVAKDGNVLKADFGGKGERRTAEEVERLRRESREAKLREDARAAKFGCVDAGKVGDPHPIYGAGRGEGPIEDERLSPGKGPEDPPSRD